MVQDSFAWFIGLVAERRKLPMPQVLLLSDGRVYTGRQAVKEKLIDEIGGEEKAIAWLSTEKKVSKDLPVVDWEPKRADDLSGFGLSIVRNVMGAFGFGHFVSGSERPKLDGMLAVWHPDL
jgi:protease-4